MFNKAIAEHTGLKLMMEKTTIMKKWNILITTNDGDKLVAKITY